LPASPTRTSHASALRTGLSIGIGVALLGLLLWHAGLDELHDEFDRLHWRAVLVLLPYVIVSIFDARSWRWALPSAVRAKPPFQTLVLARIAGEAVNSVTPTATLGGEPVKAHLLRASGVPTPDGMASIVVAKTTLTIAQGLFTAMGFVALLLVLERWWLAAGATILLLGCLVGFASLLVAFQRRNPATALWRALSRLVPSVRFVQRLEEGARAIDVRLTAFHRDEPRAFARATAWNFCGWLFGVVEVYLMCALIGHPVAWSHAFVIEAVAQPIRAVAIVIPGGLGAQEWGGAAFCQFLGMPEPAAVTLWLLKRGRETVFDAIGLLYLGWRTAVRKDA
jgi:putative membrane protein